MGVVYRVQLECVPNFEILNTEDKVSVEALEPKNLRDSHAAHDHAIYLYDPVAETVVRRFQDRVPAGSVDVPRKTAYDKPNTFQNRLKAGLLQVAKHLPDSVGLRSYVRSSTFKVRPPLVGEARFMFQEDFSFPLRDCSYGVPLDNAYAALKRVKAEFARIGYEPALPFAIRCIKGSHNTALGINSGRDTAVIEFGALKQLNDHADAMRLFEEVMREFGGRPHWGKEFSLNPEAQYPAETWAAFSRLSWQWGHKLHNAWAKSLTPVGASQGASAPQR